MKTSKFFSMVLLATVLVAPVSGQAIGLGDLSGKKSSSGSSSSVDLSGAQTSLLKQYVAASQSVLNAQELMASALGLEDNRATIKAAAKGLNSGATKGNLKDCDKASSESTEAIAAKLKENPELSAEAKVTFAKGIVSLVDGVKKYSAMKSGVASFSKSMKGISPLDLRKAQEGVYIVTSFPGNASDLVKTLNSAVSFAKGRGIKVSSDAEANGKVKLP